MIISRTPFRISFFGGGTDYPVWYKKHRGSIIGTSINKYCYITTRYLPPFFKYNYRIRYTRQEHKRRISDIKHPSVRECLNYLKIKSGIEMQHNADVPAMAGLGSSSAFTVGLLNALYSLQGNNVGKKKLALDAIFVEQKAIGENVGSQDQTLAAYGGFNKIDFGGKEIIKIVPIKMTANKLESLQDHLMLFFTGISRNASAVAATQIRVTPNRTKELKAMLQLVDKAHKILTAKNMSVQDLGRLLNESWQIKRGLTHKISNGVIDGIYSSALKAGAIGGKLLGAGGGGFILLCVEPEKQLNVKKALKKLLFVPFKFENRGSQIIYKMPDDMYNSSQ